MIKLSDNILIKFGSVFTYEAAFNWFVIAVFGFVIRFDHAGVTGFIRWLYSDPIHYNALFLFFQNRFLVG